MPKWIRSLLTILMCAAAAAGCGGRSIQSPPPPEPLRADVRDAERVSLMALGDWGSRTDSQERVAAALAAYPEPLDAGILLGDNFYMPLADGARDPAFEYWFRRLYEPLGIPLFALLGNHDYEVSAGLSKAESQLAYARDNPDGPFRMPSRYYRVDLPADEPWVTVLMLDSNHAEMSGREWAEQTRWLAAQLREVRGGDEGDRRARWVVCCGHAPIFTNGNAHDDDARLKRDWLPLLARHDVDFYLCGHNHCLEHVRPPRYRTSFVTSGGGGRGLYRHRCAHRGKFFRRHGFVHLDLEPERATVQFVGDDQQVLYAFTRERAGGAIEEGPVRAESGTAWYHECNGR